MIILFFFFLMPFEIPEMIITVISPAGEQSDKQLIPEMMLDVLFIVTSLSDGKQGITYFKRLPGNISCKLGRVVYTATSVATNIHNKMCNIFLL